MRVIRSIPFQTAYRASLTISKYTLNLLLRGRSLAKLNQHHSPSGCLQWCSPFKEVTEIIAMSQKIVNNLI